jgi:hypothetical protein
MSGSYRRPILGQRGIEPPETDTRLNDIVRAHEVGKDLINAARSK